MPCNFDFFFPVKEDLECFYKWSLFNFCLKEKQGMDFKINIYVRLIVFNVNFPGLPLMLMESL